MSEKVAAVTTSEAMPEAKRLPKIVARDRDLCGLLALARYLTTEQIRRLCFPVQQESSARKRLAQLALEPALVRRLSYRTYDGQLVPVWALTERGYALAGDRLGAPARMPRKDVGADYLEHSIGVSDLFVALFQAGGDTPASPIQHRFRWIGGEQLALPWSDYDPQKGRAEQRQLLPDATIEVPGANRRIFIEFETGTHSVVSSKKVNATTAKIGRYSKFLHGYADVAAKSTWYAKLYPDRWPAELLFVTPGQARRDSVRAAIENMRKANGLRVAVSAYTLEEAGALLRDQIGATPLPQAAMGGVPAITLSADELALVQSFFKDATATLHRMRVRVREGKPVSEPEYPSATPALKTLLARLGESQS